VTDGRIDGRQSQTSKLVFLGKRAKKIFSGFDCCDGEDFSYTTFPPLMISVCSFSRIVVLRKKFRIFFFFLRRFHNLMNSHEEHFPFLHLLLIIIKRNDDDDEEKEHFIHEKLSCFSRVDEVYIFPLENKTEN
jgi:hypothetical protein